jgi:hypothetical protein
MPNLATMLPAIIGVIVGAILTFFLGRLNYRRQIKMDLHIQRYKEGSEFVDALSRLIDRRYYYAQRLLWALESRDLEKVSNADKHYYAAVDEWNTSLRSNWNRTRLLVGIDFANQFLDYADESRTVTESLHYHFVAVHKIRQAVRGETISIDEAQAEIHNVGWHSWYFLEAVSSEFAQRATQLELLSTPKPHRLTPRLTTSGLSNHQAQPSRHSGQLS